MEGRGRVQTDNGGITLPIAEISPSPRTVKDKAGKIIRRLERGISHNVVMVIYYRHFHS